MDMDADVDFQHHNFERNLNERHLLCVSKCRLTMSGMIINTKIRIVLRGEPLIRCLCQNRVWFRYPARHRITESSLAESL